MMLNFDKAMVILYHKLLYKMNNDDALEGGPEELEEEGEEEGEEEEEDDEEDDEDDDVTTEGILAGVLSECYSDPEVQRTIQSYGKIRSCI